MQDQLLTSQFLTAEQLDITEVRREALIAALGAMQSGHVVHVIIEDGNEGMPIQATGRYPWNMNHWCGSACCIGGLADQLKPEAAFGEDENLSADLYDLFYPPRGIDYDAITIPQGIEALTNYLTTRAAGWSEIPGIQFKDED